MNVGDIPTEFVGLTGLTTFSIERNSINGKVYACEIDQENRNMQASAINLIRGVVGTIPTELASLTNLKELLLSGNGLSGR